MKALVGAFNQEKALVGAFSVIVKTDCETGGSFYSTNEDQPVDGQGLLGDQTVCLHPVLGSLVTQPGGDVARAEGKHVLLRRNMLMISNTSPGVGVVLGDAVGLGRGVPVADLPALAAGQHVVGLVGVEHYLADGRLEILY